MGFISISLDGSTEDTGEAPEMERVGHKEKKGEWGEQSCNISSEAGGREKLGGGTKMCLV